MQVTSTYRFARISAFKAREVTREIQGHSASEALDLLAFSPKKAALLVKKTLKSAIANAENNAELRVDTLLVKEAVVGEGPTFKRFRARARGGASPLRKRTSHIRIVLSDEFVPKTPEKRPKKRVASRSRERKAYPGRSRLRVKRLPVRAYRRKATNQPAPVSQQAKPSRQKRKSKYGTES